MTSNDVLEGFSEQMSLIYEYETQRSILRDVIRVHCGKANGMMEKWCKSYEDNQKEKPK